MTKYNVCFWNNKGKTLNSRDLYKYMYHNYTSTHQIFFNK